jgi:hypothetical protein
MSDKQLSALLFHIMRQVNMCSVEVERSLQKRGATLEESLNDIAVVQLAGLADVLRAQSAEMAGERAG